MYNIILLINLNIESLPIDINHILALHGHHGAIRSQGQPFTDNNNDVNESQSIDIKSIHLNNHVPNN